MPYIQIYRKKEMLRSKESFNERRKGERIKCNVKEKEGRFELFSINLISL